MMRREDLASKLPREFYTRANVLTVARELLGKLLVVPTSTGRRVSGIIVETEAYRGPQDRAAHSYGGRRTRRTETMYGIGGTAYVFFVYGMYNQFNVVTNIEDVPHAVLIRALEPVEGIDLIRKRRRFLPNPNLTNGQASFVSRSALIDRLDGADCWAIVCGLRKADIFHARESCQDRELELTMRRVG